MINKECMQVFWIHSLNYVSWGLSCGAETLEHNISIIAYVTTASKSNRNQLSQTCFCLSNRQINVNYMYCQI